MFFIKKIFNYKIYLDVDYYVIFKKFKNCYKQPINIKKQYYKKVEKYQ